MTASGGGAAPAAASEARAVGEPTRSAESTVATDARRLRRKVGSFLAIERDMPLAQHRAQRARQSSRKPLSRPACSGAARRTSGDTQDRTRNFRTGPLLIGLRSRTQLAE